MRFVNNNNNNNNNNNSNNNANNNSNNNKHGHGRHPATARRKWSKEDNKTTILCYLQAKEEPNIGFRERMHQYWKDYGLFEMGEQHLACQVSSTLKKGKQSKVEISLKRQINQLHVGSVEIEA